MATPTGYIDASDGGYPITTGGTKTIKLKFRLPYEPPHWGGGSNNRYQLAVSRQITIPAGATLTERVSTDDGSGPEVGRSTTTTSSWLDYGSSHSFPREPQGSKINVCSFASDGFQPASTTVLIRTQADTSTCQILGLCFELTSHQDDMGDPEPTDSSSYQVFGGKSGSWTPYEANRAASAWLAKDIIARNQNRLTFDTSQYWSTPL